MKNLYFVGSFPGWAIGVAVVAIAALLVYQFLALRRRLPRASSSVLILLRACVYGVLIFFLLGPALVDPRATKLRRPLTVLIDSSQSMGFPAGAGAAAGTNRKSRLDAVRETLLDPKSPLLQKLGENYDLHLFRFGTTLEPIPPRDRRISHLALKDDPLVTTRSPGSGYMRALEIVPAEGKREPRSRERSQEREPLGQQGGFKRGQKKIV